MLWSPIQFEVQVTNFINVMFFSSLFTLWFHNCSVGERSDDLAWYRNAFTFWMCKTFCMHSAVCGRVLSYWKCQRYVVGKSTGVLCMSTKYLCDARLSCTVSRQVFGIFQPKNTIMSPRWRDVIELRYREPTSRLFVVTLLASHVQWRWVPTHWTITHHRIANIMSTRLKIVPCCSVAYPGASSILLETD